MSFIDSLMSRVKIVLGQVDKWEMDTLNCAYAIAMPDHLVKFSSKLHSNAKAYIISNSPWVKLTTWKTIIDTELPNWMIQRTKEYPGAHGDLPGSAIYKFKFGNTEYSCSRGFGIDGEMSDVSCYTRTILTGYESTPVSSNCNVVSICHCPHWTPPDKIAALLASPKLTNSKIAAVAIVNDEICTHAALACQ